MTPQEETETKSSRGKTDSQRGEIPPRVSPEAVTQPLAAVAQEEKAPPVQRVHVPWNGFSYTGESKDTYPIPWDLKRWYPEPRSGSVFFTAQEVTWNAETKQKVVGKMKGNLPYGCPTFGLQEYIKIIAACQKDDLTMMEGVIAVLKDKITPQFIKVAKSAPKVKLHPNQPPEPTNPMHRYTPGPHNRCIHAQGHESYVNMR